MPLNRPASVVIQQEIFNTIHLKLSKNSRSPYLVRQYYSAYESFGTLASSRRAALVVVLFNILKKIAPSYVSEITPEDIALLQITALFQHAAWDNQGQTENFIASKINCQYFLERMGVNKYRAQYFSNLLSLDEQNSYGKKELLLKLLKSADALNNTREARSLFVWTNIPLVGVFESAGQKELMHELAKNVLDLIVFQHDLPNVCQISDGSAFNISYQRTADRTSLNNRFIKYTYVRSNNVYLKTTADFQRFPLLNEYYLNDSLRSDNHIEFNMIIDNLEQRRRLRREASTVNLEQDFLIKSLRADENNYFLQFLKGVTPPYVSGKLRWDNKKTYTVDGKGVHSRTEKTPSYTTDIKKNYSKKQSVSYGMPDYHPLPFNFSDETLKTVGIILLDIQKNALLSQFLSTYDFGSISRPNDFNSHHLAEFYFNSASGKTLFSLDQIDAFKSSLRRTKDKNIAFHNEVLARIRMTPDDKSQLFINTDTLEARLISQCYAQILQARFQEQSDINYKTSIFYYIPNSPDLHLKQYSPLEQEMDLSEVTHIYEHEDLLTEKIQTNNFEFLLFVSRDQLLPLLKKQINNHAVIIHILNNGYVHIVDFLVELKILNGSDLKSLFTDEIQQISNPDTLINILYYCIKKNNLDLFNCALSRLEDLPDCEQNLNKQITINQVNSPLLQMALVENKPDYFHKLCDHTHIDLNKTNKIGQSILHIAAYYGCTEAIAYAISKQVDINLCDNEGRSPLFFAASNGQTDCVKLLLRQPNVNVHSEKELLVTCAANAKIEVLELLHADGRFDFKETDDYERNLLFVAQENPVTIAHLLNYSEIDFSEQEPFPWLQKSNTLLHIAANKGYTQIVRLLLDKGMPIDALNKKQQTAMHALSRNSTVASTLDIFSQLLQAGACLNARDIKGRSALDLAVKYQNIALIKALVEAGSYTGHFAYLLLRSVIPYQNYSHRALTYYKAQQHVHYLSLFVTTQPVYEVSTPSNPSSITELGKTCEQSPSLF